MKLLKRESFSTNLFNSSTICYTLQLNETLNGMYTIHNHVLNNVTLKVLFFLKLFKNDII